MVVEGHLSILQSHVHVWNGAKAADAFIGTPDLSGANLSGADLAGVDFSGVNLSGANLSGANLHKADLIAADLRGADLSYAVLAKAQALETNFTRAILTGACIEDWNINGNTKLDEVICNYIYLKADQKDRCPNQGSFSPGDFFKLFQKTLNTINVILRNPDWEAFAYSFSKVQVESEGEELRIQSVENKGNGIVVVKVEVSSETNKEKIHSSLMQSYESTHTLLIGQYESRIQDKDKEINRLFYLLNQVNEKLGEVPKLMAENSKVQQTYNISGSITNFAGNVEGDQHNYVPEERQNLVEAAAEIQQLLYQLAQLHPTSTEVVAEAIHQEIKRNPTLKARLVSALKAGGMEALKAIFNHPLFSIPAETVKGWLEAE